MININSDVLLYMMKFADLESRGNLGMTCKRFASLKSFFTRALRFTESPFDDSIASRLTRWVFKAPERVLPPNFISFCSDAYPPRVEEIIIKGLSCSQVNRILLNISLTTIQRISLNAMSCSRDDETALAETLTKFTRLTVLSITETSISGRCIPKMNLRSLILEKCHGIASPLPLTLEHLDISHFTGLRRLTPLTNLKLLRCDGVQPSPHEYLGKCYTSMPFNREEMISLMQEGANANMMMENETPLLLAVTNNWFDLAHLLLEKGADPREKNPLKEALTRGYTPLCRLLLAKGARLYPEDKMTGLFQAVMFNNVDKLLFLLENCGDPNGHVNMVSLIHYALRHKSYEIAKWLLHYGASPDVLDNEGWYPLMKALFFGDQRAAILLIDHHANLNVRDEDGNTPLHLAVGYGGRDTLLPILIKAGADLNAINHEGLTPLHMALKDSLFYPPAVRLLLEHGADKSVLTPSGDTLLHWAISNNPERTLHEPLLWHKESAVRILLEMGVDPNRPNRVGITPLQKAESLGYESICRLIREAFLKPLH